MDYLRVEGHSNLLRDPKTNSIMNDNAKAYEEYVSRRKAKDKENQKIQNLEEDLTNIKSDIDEIKNLLRELLNGPR
jgi:chromosome segregation ATPase